MAVSSGMEVPVSDEKKEGDGKVYHSANYLKWRGKTRAISCHGETGMAWSRLCPLQQARLMLGSGVSH
jgi:hypothetical protein